MNHYKNKKNMIKRSLGGLLLLFAFTVGLQAQEKSPVKVACIGNSITQGVGVKNQFQDSYPGILSQWLGKEYDVRNFGFSGRTMLMNGDRPYMKEQMYQDALAFNPDIVTIKLGTNDTKTMNWPTHGQEFEGDMRTMVKAFQALPSHPKIYLCYPVPPTKVQWTINDSTIVQEIIPAIDRIAANMKLEVIDLHTPLLPYPQCFPDCVHPNEEGAQRIATEIYRKLKGEEPPAYTARQPFPGSKSTWEGYDKYTFQFHGKEAVVVSPKQLPEEQKKAGIENELKGKPWVLRSAFDESYAEADKELLKKGYHIVYYEFNPYDSPEAAKEGNAFYKVMTKYYKLNKAKEGDSGLRIHGLEIR